MGQLPATHFPHENQESPNLLGLDRSQFLEAGENSAFVPDSENSPSAVGMDRRVAGHGAGHGDGKHSVR